MTAARAPGKLVLSGAYSVFEGAPALVAAVDRYVSADSARPAERVTDEVAAAIAAGSLRDAPWFDASPLREGDRKLGLGSSAAILVASLAAALGASAVDERALRDAVLSPALTAPRVAQGGGSGIDVAASVYGGVVRCELVGPELAIAACRLPSDLVVVVLASPVAASTRELLARVRSLAARDPAAYRTAIDRAASGARSVAAASSAAEVVRGVRVQTGALAELGDLAGAAIVTAEVRELDALAASEGATVAPSGAGGGDVALFLGMAPPSAALRARARAIGLSPVELGIGARGVHLA